MDTMEYKDIGRINDILKGRINRTQMALLEIDPMVIDYFKLTRYMENPVKRINLIYKQSEYKELGALCKKHGIKDLSAFAMERLRALNTQPTQ